RVLHDGDTALGADHVLHEERLLTHHRAPAGFVPAHGAVVEGDVEHAVVVHAGLQLFREAGAHGADADGFRAGHLAHHVHVVHAAVHDGAHAVHEVAVPVPGVAAALLIQVHTHDQRLAEALGQLDELRPGGVHAEDVADDDLAVLGDGGVDD